jgi:hypothetical protein
LILSNLIQTLSQIAPSNNLNAPLVIEQTPSGFSFATLSSEEFAALTSVQFSGLSSPAVWSVSFYVDPGRTQLLFTEDSNANPTSFSTLGTRTFYVPPATKLNTAAGLSTTDYQPVYYVNVLFNGVTTLTTTYDNSQNLLFQSVIVSNDKSPKFASNANLCVIVPCDDVNDNSRSNDTYSTVTLTFDLYLQLLIYDWTNLSELNRTNVRMNVQNLIRNALYADRYRNGNSCLRDRNVDGTYVGQIKPLASNDVLKASLRVQCAFLVTPQTY